MTHHATQTLQELGYRLTPQRELVWDVLRQEDRHMEAEEVGRLVQERFSHVNMSTVYRTLELLVELDLVRETHLGPHRRCYEIEEGTPHHHLVCEKCGRVEHLSGGKATAFVEEISRERGFLPREFVVTGTCRPCTAEQAADPGRGGG